ncbi:hypothetical protein [Pedobacter sp. MC2016-14]|nr:hypothetical protein [Pedobacter sp. MC2016-14]
MTPQPNITQGFLAITRHASFLKVNFWLSALVVKRIWKGGIAI